MSSDREGESLVPVVGFVVWVLIGAAWIGFSLLDHYVGTEAVVVVLALLVPLVVYVLVRGSLIRWRDDGG